MANIYGRGFSIFDPDGNLDMETGRVINAGNPINSQDLTTKIYVDTAFGATYPATTTLDEILPPVADLDMNGYRVINMANGTSNSHAINLGQLNSGLATKLSSTSTLNSIATANPTSGSVDLNNNRLINVSDPISNQDAVTKLYNDEYDYDHIQDIQGNTPNTKITTTITTITEQINGTVIKTDENDTGALKTTTKQEKHIMAGGANTFEIRGDNTSFTNLQINSDNNLGVNNLALVQFGTNNNQAQFGAGTFDLGSGQRNVTFIQGNLLQSDGITLYSQTQGFAGPSMEMQGDTYTDLDAIPINFNRKTGYKTATTIDQAQQFTDKTYVDTEDANTLTSANNYTDSQIAGIPSGEFIYNSTSGTKLTTQAIDNYVRFEAPPSVSFGFDMANINNISNRGLITNLQTNTADLTSAVNIATLNAHIPTRIQDVFDIEHVAVSGGLGIEVRGNLVFEIPSTYTISNLNDPTTSDQATTKNYVDLALAGKMNASASLDQIATTNPTAGSVSMNSHLVTNVLNPVSAQDVSTKNYTDTRTINTLSAQTADYSTNGHKLTGGLPGTVSTDFTTLSNKIHQFALPTASLDMNSQKIVNLLDPTQAQDAASKAYVDSIITSSFGYLVATTSQTVTSNINIIAQLGSAITITLPSSPADKDRISIYDAFGLARAFNITINPNSHNINGLGSNYVLSTNFQYIEIVYNTSGTNWIIQQKTPDKFIYSTSEQQTGKIWVDGVSPIYQKTYSITTPALISTNQTLETFGSLTYIIGYEGNVKQASSSVFVGLPDANIMQVFNNSNVLTMALFPTSGSSYTSQPANITVYYVK